MLSEQCQYAIDVSVVVSSYRTTPPVSTWRPGMAATMQSPPYLIGDLKWMLLMWVTHHVVCIWLPLI